MNRPRSSGPDELDPADPHHWPPPPEPSARAWEKTRAGVIARLPNPTPPRRSRAVMTVAAGLGVLAAVVSIAWWLRAAVSPPVVPPQQVPVANVEPADPLAGYDVLPIATASDVMVSVVRGSEVRFGSFSHPVPEVMPLASAADVTVLRGPAAGELSCPDAGGMAVYVMPPADK